MYLFTLLIAVFEVFGWYFTSLIRIRGSANFGGSGSGSRKPNLADPSDPDPKHWMYLFTLHSCCVPDNAFWNIACHILSLKVVFLFQRVLVLTVVKHFQTMWSVKLWNWKTTYLTLDIVMHTDTFHLISVLLNCFMTTSNN